MNRIGITNIIRTGLISVFCLIYLFINPSQGLSEKLYKYRDKNGILHYSNIPPFTDRVVEVRQLRVSGVTQRVKVSNRKFGNRHELYASNQYAGPVELEIKLTDFANIKTDRSARIILSGESETLVFTIEPKDIRKKWYYKYGYVYTPGKPGVKHSCEKGYLPPFRDNESHVISQAFFGQYSHTKPGSRYAVDIAMPVGTPVCAARSGVVMDVSDDFFTGGVDKDEYISRANFIRILHDDGTMAVYAHLKLESAQVTIGTRVTEGQVIGESGNTGFSSGPHLHFMILKNSGMANVTVPFFFRDKTGVKIKPEENIELFR